MPTGTLILPRNMIEAAYSYADKESLSVVDFFAKLLHDQYGYVLKTTVDIPARRNIGRIVSPRVRALRGIAKSSDNRPYDDLLAEAIGERYEAQQ